MLVITNYARKGGPDKWSPTTRRPERVFELHPKDRDPGNSVYFLRRENSGALHEIGSDAFFSRTRGTIDQEILLYIHGFNTTAESAFQRATALQDLLDERFSDSQKTVEVILILWPCDEDLGIVNDYWDDQDAADNSGFGFARVLGKFLEWREKRGADDACYRPINVLSHSMGNRVLRFTLDRWTTYKGGMPAIFKNVFMFAPDIDNQSLEPGWSGHRITKVARNVVVYHANDDLAMSASKVANIPSSKTISRRLGHTGPEDMRRVPKNVFSIDCDDFNNQYDRPKGHSYFLRDEGTMAGQPGLGFKHMAEVIETGRVTAEAGRTLILNQQTGP